MRAPLNSRVGASASIPKTKGKAKEDVLDNLPVDIQEALILEDLLYVLMVCLCMWSLCSRLWPFLISAGTTCNPVCVMFDHDFGSAIHLIF